MRLAARIFGLIAGLSLLGCGDDSTQTTAISRPELVAVSPEDFLGAVACGKDGVRSYVATLFDVTPGADGGTPDPGTPLPSSPPTSCRFTVTFSNVIVNHRYLAQVDGYDRVPQREIDGATITSVNGEAGAGGEAGTSGDAVEKATPADIAPEAPGSRTQLDRTGKAVTAGWAATCSGFPRSPRPGSAGAGGASGNESIGSGDAGVDERIGVVSYDGLTRTVHNCGAGLVPVTL